MYLNMSGYGADTTQLPIFPQPAGVISGYKWEDDNQNGIKDGFLKSSSPTGASISVAFLKET